MYKKNSEKYKLYFLLIVIGVLFFLLWLKNNTIDSLRTINTEITHEVTMDGKYMATQRQNIMNLEDAIKSGLLEKERYMKNVKSQTKIETTTIVSALARNVIPARSP